jgi:hypothetical protein
MPSGPVFPAFLKIEHQRDGSAKSSFIAEVNSMLGDAERRFKSFSDEASRQLNSALSVPRNKSGSLDLGVDELKAAAAAQQARALAAREVAAATEAAARAEGDYSQNARMAIAATQALAREEEEAASRAMSHARAAEQIQEQLNKQASATTAVAAAMGRGTTAQQSVINSTRATRTAFIQLGQQMQDVVVQAQMGTNAFMIFAQQAPQAAFALSGLEGSANKTQARIGQFATFMAGPWGAAIFAATAVLGPLAYNLLKAGDAADDAEGSIAKMLEKLKDQQRQSDYSEKANRLFERSLEGVTKAADDARKAVETLQGRQRTQAETAIRAASAALKNAQAIREEAMANLDAARAYNERYKGSLASADPRFESQFKVSDDAIDKQKDLIQRGNKVIESLESSLTVLKSFDAVEKASRSAEQRINDNYDDQIERAREAAVANNQVGASFNRQVEAINKLREADLKSLRERERAQKGLSKATQQYGREIDLQAAKEIATRNKLRVTSDLRSREKQQWLYDNKRTPTNPVAKPGTSAHERGNALDIAFGPGITAASIKKMYADEGVRLTKILKEDGHFHIEWSTSGADKVIREAQRIEDFGEKAAESIQRITERFDDQPKLIDQVEQATRQLNDIMGELADQQPPGFENLIATAERAKTVVADAINRPFREYMEDQQRSLDLQYLSLAGREDEAAALQTMYRLMDQVGVVTAEQRDKILANVAAQRQMNELLAKQQEIIGAYTDSLSSVRSDLEGLLGGSLGGKSFLKNMQANFQQLQGKLLTEQLFGPMLRALEDQIRQSTGIKSSLDVMKEGMEDGGKSASVMATALEQAAERVNRTFTGGGIGGVPGSTSAGGMSDAAWKQVLGDFDAIIGSANDNGATDEIVVTAARKTADATSKVAMGISAMRPEDYAVLLGNAITAPLSDAFKSIGLDISGTLSGVLAGNMVGGLPGAIVGGLKGFMGDFGTSLFGEGTAKVISGALDGALKGVAMGTQTAGLMKALGLKTSTLGSQIGGGLAGLSSALGGALGPLGAIGGSILGGLIGGLFKTARTARANITGVGSVDLGGKDSKNYGTASDLADSVISGLKNIADELGASIGSFNTTIGVRDKDYRVNANGTSLKTGNGAVNFGDDSAAAIKFAIADAIKDGALLGLRQSTLALLQAGDDIEAQLQKALSFENVFKELRKYTDPVGGAIEEINDQFRDLIAIFGEAGASAEEWAQLEQLYSLKRAEAVKAANAAIISSLQDLYDFLTYGDSGLSLRDRDTELRGRYGTLKARVESGDTTAYDEYAKVARELLEVERQLYGSTQQYFDLAAEVKKTSGNAIDRQNALAAAAQNSDNPFSGSSVSTTSDNSTVVTAIDNLSVSVATNLGYKLDAVNDNLGAMLAQNQALYAQILAQYGNIANGNW